MVGFPLLLVPLALYNMVAFLMDGGAFTAEIKIPMMAGRVWPVTLNDGLLALGILLLLLEIIKCAQPGARRLMDHLLSLIVFGLAAAEFVMLPKFGTSTFFLLMLLAMTDFFGGVAHRTRRRFVLTEVVPVSPDPVPVAHDPVPVARDPVPSKTTGQAEPSVLEPRLDAVPQPSALQTTALQTSSKVVPVRSKTSSQVEEPVVEPRMPPAPQPSSQAEPVAAPLPASAQVTSSADDPAPHLQPSATDPASAEAPPR